MPSARLECIQIPTTLVASRVVAPCNRGRQRQKQHERFHRKFLIQEWIDRTPPSHSEHVTLGISYYDSGAAAVGRRFVFRRARAMIIVAGEKARGG